MKTINTSPAVYFCPETSSGHYSEPITHLEPYQNPKEYESNIIKNIDPNPKPEYMAYLHVELLASYKHSI